MKRFELDVEGRRYWIKILDEGPQGATVEVDGKPYSVRLGAKLALDGEPASALPSSAQPAAASMPASPAQAAEAAPEQGCVEIRSPMPGTILQLLVEPGTLVQAGQALMVLEAMKMENQIASPVAGTVERLEAVAGREVSKGRLLAVIRKQD
ncbi:MAG: biotin/lipoyl-containing protein [Candidatus Alcyoniella australis]|nr:biotin/lipoyl-containing protein [Candidatus Alcyoniella australis]